MCVRQPVLISGMFRSGTTLWWRVLSADPFFKAYLPEPLHPQLPQEIELHKHYRVYQEYSGIMQKWSATLWKEGLQLTATDSHAKLEQYLSQLIHEGALLKFVRMTLRLGWLLDKFPNAFVVNIVRDPRAVCYSYLKNTYVDRLSARVKSKVFGKIYPISSIIDSQDLNWSRYWAPEYFELFRNLPRWGDYIGRLGDEPPYVKILALWQVNVQQSIEDLDRFAKGRSITVCHEHFCQNPEETLRRIYERLGDDPPEMVLKEAQGNTVHDLGGEKKWQGKISLEWLEEWKQVGNRIWEKGLERASIIPLMRNLGYYEKQ